MSLPSTTAPPLALAFSAAALCTGSKTSLSGAWAETFEAAAETSGERRSRSPDPSPVDARTFGIQVHPARERREPLSVGEVDVLAQGQERRGPVCRARVEVHDPEAPRNGPRDRALPAPRGPVYGYENASHGPRKYSRKPRRFTVTTPKPQNSPETSCSRTQGPRS